MIMERYKGMFNSVTSVIEEYFDLRRYTISKAYSNSIEISGKRLNTRIYIRYELNHEGIVVNISSIELDKSTRRKGLLTGLIKVISNVECVNAIKIGGVCTPEMKSWCEKNKFINNGYADYIYPLNKGVR